MPRASHSPHSRPLLGKKGERCPTAIKCPQAGHIHKGLVAEYQGMHLDCLSTILYTKNLEKKRSKEPKT